jgi:DNA polymerase
MVRLEENGYPVVLSVHDEIISEVDENTGNIEEFNAIMEDSPEWAKGLPVATKGFETKRYSK